MPRDEPCGHRQEAVVLLRAAPLELGQASGTLRLEDPDGALDLVEIGGELVGPQVTEILFPELVDGRTKRAHLTNLTNTRSDVREIRHFAARPVPSGRQGPRDASSRPGVCAALRRSLD